VALGAPDGPGREDRATTTVVAMLRCSSSGRGGTRLLARRSRSGDAGWGTWGSRLKTMCRSDRKRGRVGVRTANAASEAVNNVGG
jgi:hypothetical protein